MVIACVRACVRVVVDIKTEGEGETYEYCTMITALVPM